MLEASGKWPDDLEAVKRVKAAFHLQLSSLLNSKCNLQTNAFPTHVDVFKVSLRFPFILKPPTSILIQVYYFTQII